jgi:hypothetical protein
MRRTRILSLLTENLGPCQAAGKERVTMIPAPTSSRSRMNPPRAAARPAAGPLPALLTIFLAFGGALAISHLLVVLGLH